MNWIKLKNIMLAFLIFINLALIALLCLFSFRENTIPENVIMSSIELLLKDGFKCSRNVFPSTYKNVPCLYADYYTASELSDMFFGKQVPFKTEGDALIANYSNATLTVKGTSFLYKTDCDFVKNTDTVLIKKLKKTGFDMRGCSYSASDRRFYKYYNNVKIFSAFIEVRLDGDRELCYAYGQWPKTLKAAENTHMSFTSEIIKMKEHFPLGGEIKEIEFGYSAREFKGGKYTFVPAWSVKVNDETKIISD